MIGKVYGCVSCIFISIYLSFYLRWFWCRMNDKSKDIVIYGSICFYSVCVYFGCIIFFFYSLFKSRSCDMFIIYVLLFFIYYNIVYYILYDVCYI